MNKSKQKPIPFPAEYKLLMTYKYSPQFKAMVVHLALRTIEEFGNFRYEIVVLDSIKGNTLNLSVQGLRAPRQTLPSSGPATFTKEYRNMQQIEEVVISKLDGVENSFRIKISPDTVTVKKNPKNQFVQFVTNEMEW